MNEDLFVEILKSLGTYIYVKKDNKKVFSNIPSDFKVSGSEIEYNGSYFDGTIKEVPFNNEKYQVLCYQDVTKYIKKIYEDSKTGVLSTVGFREQVDQLVEKKEPFIMGIFDIDNFKKYNDTYGHEIGDETLSIVSKIFGSNIKEKDLIGRFGGDEFLFALKGVSKEIATRRVQEISKRISSGIKFSNGQIIPVTLSIGMDNYSFDNTYEENFKRVDDLLYNSKRSGKNKISNGEIEFLNPQTERDNNSFQEIVEASETELDHRSKGMSR